MGISKKPFWFGRKSPSTDKEILEKPQHYLIRYDCFKKRYKLGDSTGTIWRKFDLEMGEGFWILWSVWINLTIFCRRFYNELRLFTDWTQNAVGKGIT